MAFKVDGEARVAFTNVPGLAPSTPDNGELKVQQADGLLVTRRSDGTKRLTDLRPMAEQLAAGPLADQIRIISSEGGDLRLLGFVGDGASHPLSAVFSTLAEAQAAFPRATALTEEIDGHVIQREIDRAVAADREIVIVLPRGARARTSIPIDSTQARACGVFSTGGAAIVAVGSAAGAWAHGTASSRASGPIMWRGVDLENASGASGATGLTTFFGSPGVGSTLAVSVENCRIRGFTTGWRIGNMPRGLKADNVVVYGPDFQIQPGGGIEIVATADVSYGSFSFKFTNCLVLNYTWGWNLEAASALEGIVWEHCKAYSGWGFARAISTKSNYQIILLTFQDCDWEGAGFALDMTNVRLLKVDGGFWFMHCETPPPFPAAVQTDGGERRMFNLHNVTGFDFQRLEMVAAGGVDGAPLPTNFVLANVDPLCILGLFDGNMIVTDHVLATCLFRLSGARPRTVIERNTRINYVWGGLAPTILYGGAVANAYQISAADVAAKGGTVSDEGYYRFSGVSVVTTGADGRATIPLPRRAPGLLQFFEADAPRVQVTTGNSNVHVPAVSLIQTTPTDFTIVANNAAPGVQIAVYWTAEGF